MNDNPVVPTPSGDDELREVGFDFREGDSMTGKGDVSPPGHEQASSEPKGKKFTDGMRQTVVADLKRLGLHDTALSLLARKGDLDGLLNALEDLPPSKRAKDTAYMIPLIRAWQQQLGRPGNPPTR